MTAIATGLGVVTMTALLWLPALGDGGTSRDDVASRLHAQIAPRQPAPQQPPVPPGSLGSAQFAYSHACAPAEVLTTKTLVTVRCRTAVQAKGLEEVSLFAVGIEDPAFASRVLRVAMSAQVAGYSVKITFIPSDVSGERLGCQAKTCRLIQTISMSVQ